MAAFIQRSSLLPLTLVRIIQDSLTLGEAPLPPSYLKLLPPTLSIIFHGLLQQINKPNSNYSTSIHMYHIISLSLHRYI